MHRAMIVMGIVALAAVAFAAAPAASADAADAWCTASYPADCQAHVGGVRVSCSDVGTVPDCDVG